MPKADSTIICKSIFKDGKTTTSKDKFTRTWIDLINQLEKCKNIMVRLRAELSAIINNRKTIIYKFYAAMYNRHMEQACFYLLRRDKNE